MKFKRNKKLAKLILRFSDFILGFVVAALVMALGHHAMAESPIDSLVNVKIKEEFYRMDLEQQKAAMEMGAPKSLENVRPNDGSLVNRPVDYGDPLIDHQDNISAEEQSQHFDRPRAGISKKIDPLDAIESQLANQQAYDLYQEHYRGAVRNEMVGRAKQIGINPSDALAAEIISRAVDGQSAPYPSNLIPQN